MSGCLCLLEPELYVSSNREMICNLIILIPCDDFGSLRIQLKVREFIVKYSL